MKKKKGTFLRTAEVAERSERKRIGGVFIKPADGTSEIFEEIKATGLQGDKSERFEDGDPAKKKKKRTCTRGGGIQKGGSCVS